MAYDSATFFYTIYNSNDEMQYTLGGQHSSFVLLYNQTNEREKNPNVIIDALYIYI
jgi:hypothetical protein